MASTLQETNTTFFFHKALDFNFKLLQTLGSACFNASPGVDCSRHARLVLVDVTKKHLYDLLPQDLGVGRHGWRRASREGGVLPRLLPHRLRRREGRGAPESAAGLSAPAEVQRVASIGNSKSPSFLLSILTVFSFLAR